MCFIAYISDIIEVANVTIPEFIIDVEGIIKGVTMSYKSVLATSLW